MPRRKRDWFDHSEFWEAFYPFMFPESRFVATADQIDAVLDLAQPRGRAVLDLCCGPGRCAIALAERGFQVTGVDLTEFLLAKARQRAREAKVKVEWIRRDMRDFSRPGAFDLILNMFTSFGYFEHADDDLAALRRMHDNLKPGGRCVIELACKEWLAREFQPTSSEMHEDGTLLVERRSIAADWTRVHNEWMLIQGDRARRFKFSHTIYSGRELKDRMLAAGFARVQLFGGFDGRPFGVDVQRLIAIGERADLDSE
jgi:SAM-dependent methyltransferase